MIPEEEARRWPEHNKMRHPQRVERRDAIEGFVEWLTENGYVIAKDDGGIGHAQRVWPREEHHLVMEHLGADIEKYKAEEAEQMKWAAAYFGAREHYGDKEITVTRTNED